MRRFFILLTFVLIASLVQTSEARKFALLVGVDSYVSVPSLKCCVNDMKTLKEALMKIGFEENDIQILVTGPNESKDLPTKRNIERNISKILTNAQPDDMVFLALSGHGAQEGKNVYFCPLDVEVEDLPGTCVSINKVMDLFANKCRAKFKWLVVDACRNDPTQGPKGIGGKGLQVIPTPPAGIALFQSCAEGEQSWEDYDSGYGYFTKNLVAALSGEADSDHDGKLTLMEVCKWTTAKTKEQVSNTHNKSQRPYFSGSVSDFTLTEDVNVRKAQELATEAQKAMDEENYELAIQKYDEAIALCPRIASWKRERDLVKQMLEMKSRMPSDGGDLNASEELPPSQSLKSFKRKLAVLIGVNDYGNASRLRCCVNDMNNLKAALLRIGFEEDDIIMLVSGGPEDNLPLKKNIEKKLSEIMSIAQSSDMVFIAFSGFGNQIGDTVYLIPSDVVFNNIEGTSISVTKIMNDLSKCQAGYKLVVADCGRTGINRERLEEIPEPPKGVGLFLSCSLGEYSMEDSENHSGFFTKNLVAALSGEADSNHDGYLTLMEVCKWTTAKTTEQVKNRYDMTQRPYFSGSILDLALTEDVNLRKAQALAKEAQKAMDEENYVLAVQKYDEAIALCPRFENWKRERNLAQKLLKARVPSTGGNIQTPVEQRPVPAPVQGSSLDTPGTRAGEKRIVTVNDVEFAFCWCPRGTFMMGFEKGVHRQETLSKGFWIMETEVTQKQWKAIMETNPSVFKGDDLPVEHVTWNDCQEFCKKCEKLGFPVQLPTEAQWEYACRAGTTGAFAGNLDKMAWYSSNSGGKTNPVRKKQPNAWGLYDMHGNVWEWCQNGGPCIARGGGWDSPDSRCHSASGINYAPVAWSQNLGFRCVFNNQSGN